MKVKVKREDLESALGINATFYCRTSMCNRPEDFRETIKSYFPDEIEVEAEPVLEKESPLLNDILRELKPKEPTMRRYRVNRVDNQTDCTKVAYIADGDIIELEPIEEKSDVDLLADWLDENFKSVDRWGWVEVATALLDLGLDVSKLRGK